MGSWCRNGSHVAGAGDGSGADDGWTGAGLGIRLGGREHASSRGTSAVATLGAPGDKGGGGGGDRQGPGHTPAAWRFARAGELWTRRAGGAWGSPCTPFYELRRPNSKQLAGVELLVGAWARLAREGGVAAWTDDGRVERAA